MKSSEPPAPLDPRLQAPSRETRRDFIKALSETSSSIRQMMSVESYCIIDAYFQRAALDRAPNNVVVAIANYLHRMYKF